MVYKSGQIFLPFVTIHAFDRQTDRILIARPRLHSMQRAKSVRGMAASRNGRWEQMLGICSGEGFPRMV